MARPTISALPPSRAAARGSADSGIRGRMCLLNAPRCGDNYRRPSPLRLPKAIAGWRRKRWRSGSPLELTRIMFLRHALSIPRVSHGILVVGKPSREQLRTAKRCEDSRGLITRQTGPVLARNLREDDLPAPARAATIKRHRSFQIETNPLVSRRVNREMKSRCLLRVSVDDADAGVQQVIVMRGWAGTDAVVCGGPP